MTSDLLRPLISPWSPPGLPLISPWSPPGLPLVSGRRRRRRRDRRLLETDLEKIVTNWLKMYNAPAISPTEVAQKLSHFKQVNLDG